MKYLGWFAEAWGTLSLVIFGFALVARANINLGTGATILVMVGCALYALIRGIVEQSRPDRVQQLEQDNAALRALVRQLSHAAPPPSVPPAWVHGENATSARTRG